MAAPFNFKELSRRAEAMTDELRSSDDYREDFWTDSVIGPWLRVYVLLTHFPDEAFFESYTEEQLAESRVYAYARIARLHARRDGCECMEVDGLDDLMTEYDLLEGADIVGALKAGNADANKQFAKLKKSGEVEALDH